MGKRTHRQKQLIHIQGRRAEAFRQLTEGIPHDRTLIAPLDIGKNADWAAFHTRDGLGIRLWMRLGGEVAIITGRSGMALRHRADELGIRHVFQGVGDKRRAFGEALAHLDLAARDGRADHQQLVQVPFDQVKVVVLGQDPYHGPGQVVRRASAPKSLDRAACEISAA